MKDYVQIIGFFATSLTILSFTFKDILTIRIVNALGSCIWLVYAFYSKDHPVMLVSISVITIQLWNIFILLKDKIFPPQNKNQVL